MNIRILTNSLASTDEAAVHAGYVKHREELLRAGIWLYELKPTAAKASGRNRIRFGSGSTSALHAKSFVVDRQRYFAGSFNFDQRSALLNTEMGFVIDSSKVGRDMTAIFDVDVPLAAYEVRIAPDGRSLEWIERTDSGEVRHDTEPGTSWFQRSTIDFLSIFPIDWML